MLAKLAGHIRRGFQQPIHLEPIPGVQMDRNQDLQSIVHKDLLAEIRRIDGGFKCTYVPFGSSQGKGHSKVSYNIFLYGIRDTARATVFAQYVVSWIYAAHAAFRLQPCSPNQEFHLFLSVENKKELPNVRAATVGEHHVNSAFTYRCSPDRPVNQCFIYRSEEWFKVFIHESIHALGMDFSSGPTETAILESCFPIRKEMGEYRIEESFVETWAELVYLWYYSEATLREGPPSHTNVFDDALNVERRFAIYQVAKLLKHFGMDVDDINTKEWTRWSESSSVFAYYFARMLALNDPEFMDRWPLPFVSGSNRPTKYARYVCDLYRQNFPKEELRAFMRGPKNANLEKTARMVVHDIEVLRC